MVAIGVVGVAVVVVVVATIGEANAETEKGEDFWGLACIVSMGFLSGSRVVFLSTEANSESLVLVKLSSTDFWLVSISGFWTFSATLGDVGFLASFSSSLSLSLSSSSSLHGFLMVVVVVVARGAAGFLAFINKMPFSSSLSSSVSSSDSDWIVWRGGVFLRFLLTWIFSSSSSSSDSDASFSSDSLMRFSSSEDHGFLIRRSAFCRTR